MFAADMRSQVDKQRYHPAQGLPRRAWIMRGKRSTRPDVVVEALDVCRAAGGVSVSTSPELRSSWSCSILAQSKY